MHPWSKGRTSAFQADRTGSNPVGCFSIRKAGGSVFYRKIVHLYYYYFKATMAEKSIILWKGGMRDGK